MDIQQNFAMLAAYNAWANQILYGSAAVLSEAEWAQDTGVFFGSMMGTLNHILAGDRIWMKRFTGEGTAPSALDDILHDEFEPLWEARKAEDERIVAYVAGLSGDSVSGRFTYMTVTDMRTVSQRLAPALAHFFNHQTHHRGQAHAILTILGHEAPPLDLIYFQRTPEGRAFA